MAMTRRGVFHNLEESEYRVSNGDTLLFFSSEFYLNKFLNEHKEYRTKFRKDHKAIAEEFDDEIDFISDIHYYKTIEKRGFRVLVEGDSLTWQVVLIYALVGKIGKHIEDWLRTPEQS